MEELKSKKKEDNNNYKNRPGKFNFRNITIFLILAFIFTFILSSFTKNTESEFPLKVKIGTIRVPNDKTVAYKMGYLKKYFDDRGIKVEFIFFDSGTAANVAFASGDLDFAEMGYTNGVVALNRGIDVELIWIHELLGANEALVVREDSGIESVIDLKGKVVATPFSSTSHYSLMKALELNGMTARNITLLDMNTEDIMAAWNRGDIDAAYTWEPTLTEIKKTGRVLLDSEDMAKQGVTTVNIDMVNRAFAKKYPNLVSDYLKAMNEAVSLYRAEPEKAIQAAADQLDVDFETIETQIKGTIWISQEEQLDKTYLGTNDQPGDFRQTFLETGKFLVNEKKIDKVPTLEEIDQFINTEYIERNVIE